MDTPGNPCIGYRISTESRRWMLLTSETEWKDTTKLLVKRVLAARMWAVSMEVKDMVRINTG